jgi:hypothetical protein
LRLGLIFRKLHDGIPSKNLKIAKFPANNLWRPKWIHPKLGSGLAFCLIFPSLVCLTSVRITEEITKTVRAPIGKRRDLTPACVFDHRSWADETCLTYRAGV